MLVCHHDHYHQPWPRGPPTKNRGPKGELLLVSNKINDLTLSYIIQFTICSSASSNPLLTNLFFFQLLRQSSTPWVSLFMHTQPHGEHMFKYSVKWQIYHYKHKQILILTKLTIGLQWGHIQLSFNRLMTRHSSRQPTQPQLLSNKWPGSTAAWPSTLPSTAWWLSSMANSWKTKLFQFLQEHNLLQT